MEPQGKQIFRRIQFLDPNDSAKQIQSATLRWEGLLQPKKPQIWYGIEWDNFNRGKHDGKFKNFQLFHSFFTSENSSFIKKEVLEAGLVDTAKTSVNENSEVENVFDQFFISLRDLYPDFFTDGDRDFKLDEINIGGKIVENTGINYRVKKLTAITLRNCQIVLNSGSFYQKLPETLDTDWTSSVQSLDLSLNFVQSLENLDIILNSFLPKLVNLELSGNQINFEELEGLNEFLLLKNLECLKLNVTNLTFANLNTLIGLLPNLRKNSLKFFILFSNFQNLS